MKNPKIAAEPFVSCPLRKREIDRQIDRQRERERQRDRQIERERWKERVFEKEIEKEIDKSIERCKDWDRKYTVNKSYKSFPDIKFLVNSNNYHKNKKITSKISEAG